MRMEAADPMEAVATAIGSESDDNELPADDEPVGNGKDGAN
jgi:hypothetical protein